MKILHQNGYTAKEIATYKQIVLQNITQCTEQLLVGRQRLEIDFASAEAKQAAEELYPENRVNRDASITERYDASKAIWADAGIQETFSHANQYQLNDSAGYFMDNLDRMADPSYEPTVADILHCRVRTTGITETHFQFDGLQFTLVDVGGQRKERKKWIHFFEGVTAILFVVAMSEYDQKLFEDESVNRMDESLKLFDQIANNPFFKDTAIILFLNKEDIFKQKLATGVSISVCFPEYTGPTEFGPSAEFITKQFQKLNRNPSKQIYRHYTTATDTRNTQVVFNAVTDIILNQNLADMGMM